MQLYQVFQEKGVPFTPQCLCQALTNSAVRLRLVYLVLCAPNKCGVTTEISQYMLFRSKPRRVK